MYSRVGTEKCIALVPRQGLQIGWDDNPGKPFVSATFSRVLTVQLVSFCRKKAYRMALNSRLCAIASERMYSIMTLREEKMNLLRSTRKRVLQLVCHAISKQTVLFQEKTNEKV